MDVLTPKSGIETGSSDFYKMTFTDMKVFVASLKQILCNSENIQTLTMKIYERSSIHIFPRT